MTIVIPAYKPDEKLLSLLAELKNITSSRIILVNDGSGKEFDPIFEKAASLCDKILIHEINRGKGAAMKTAFAYLLEKGIEKEAVCTADADGQHLPCDILSCLDCATKNPGALVLGSRHFTGDVPARSRFGNTVSRHTFRLLMGKMVYDTQTGLRAFSPSLLPQMLAIKEDRYEYEMQMLCNAVRQKTPIVEVEISTVYLEENKSSHFSPLKDSLKVYGLLIRCALGPFFQVISFLFSSCFAFVVDGIAFFLLLHLLMPLLLGDQTDLIDFTSLLIARVISSVLNFAINGKVVFRNTKNPTRSFVLYFLLVAAIFFANDFLIDQLRYGLKLHSVPAHILAQAICFPVSFFVQKYIVFPHKKEKK